MKTPNLWQTTSSLIRKQALRLDVIGRAYRRSSMVKTANRIRIKTQKRLMAQIHADIDPIIKTRNLLMS